ncbi:TraR/DksA C4-type zinc finger protein [Micromonospora yasonensis]|uniref:TraR/DksA family transcriptional regulator n=1 Tax=Micromonospora yasonensis TaxID=1128667 RepID=UPI00222ECC35|nr:TraR/DksA C4-type zinc finger protein [Micromonospora yasonensis]MCW3839093.1 TraR/DksA C4-type zinc finger protein [Micromonospora yasonensis]
MYAASRQDELGVLRIVLEEQYERHSTQLALLARQARQAPGDGAGLDAASALAAASRRALSDIARALHYLELGHYGSCVRCHRDIPIEQLALRPAGRFCITCQAGTTPTSPTAGPPRRTLYGHG